MWKCQNCGLVRLGSEPSCYCGAPQGYEVASYDWYDAILFETQQARMYLDSEYGVRTVTMDETREYLDAYLKMASELIVANYDKLEPSQRENLHSIFFNHGTILVKDMTAEELRLHKQFLVIIATWARSEHSAADAKERDVKAKASTSQRAWLVTDDNPNPNVSDAIKAVASRKERMSKGDKLKDAMKKAGLDDDAISKIMGIVPGTMGGGRDLVDKRPPAISFNAGPPISRDSLLAEASNSLVERINTDNPDVLASLAVTVGHLANKQLASSTPELSETSSIEPTTIEPSKEFKNPFAN